MVPAPLFTVAAIYFAGVGNAAAAIVFGVYAALNVLGALTILERR